MDTLYGWTGKIAHVDLTSGETGVLATDLYLEKFIGGRGIASRLYYDFVGPAVTAEGSENAIIFMTGPLTGSAALACSRLTALFKSPLSYPEQCALASLGGFLPGRMKAAGYDGLVITGVSATPCYISVSNGRVAVKGADKLWGLDTELTRKKLTAEYGDTADALCIGPAGERQVRFSIAAASLGATVGHGIGAVMGAKRLKALVVQGKRSVAVARPDELKQLNRTIRSMVKGRELMDPMINGIELVKRTPCYGCPAGCSRGLYQHVSGKKEYRKNCASSYFYYDLEKNYYNGSDNDQSFLATSLCNRLGICTQELSKLFGWMDKCFACGLLTSESLELDWSRVGTPEFFQLFADNLLAGKGIWNCLAQGTVRSAHYLGLPAVRLLEDIVEGSGFSADLYNGRYFLTTAVIHATDRVNPMTQLHEVVYPLFKWVLWYATDGAMSKISTDIYHKISRKFWINEQAVDFSTYNGKGRVAAVIQNREYAKETLVACDFFYPLVTPEGIDDHVGDPTIEPRLLSAVTGMHITEQDYYLIGERLFNLQRLISAREGHRGRADDVLPEFNFIEPLMVDKIYFGMFNPDFMLPGPDGKLITRKGATLDRNGFRMMMDEYYQARGWDPVSGMPSRETLQKLSINVFSDQ